MSKMELLVELKCRVLNYRVKSGSEEFVASGMALMHAGLPIPREIPEFTAFIYHLTVV